MGENGSQINSPSQMLLAYDVSRQMETINIEDQGRSSFATNPRAKTPSANLRGNASLPVAAFTKQQREREMSNGRRNPME